MRIYLLFYDVTMHKSKVIKCIIMVVLFRGIVNFTEVRTVMRRILGTCEFPVFQFSTMDSAVRIHFITSLAFDLYLINITIFTLNVV